MNIDQILVEESKAQAALDEARKQYADRSLELRILLGQMIQDQRERMNVSRDRAASILGMPTGRASLYIAEDPVGATKSYSVEKQIEILRGMQSLEKMLPSISPVPLGQRGRPSKRQKQHPTTTP